MTDTDKAAQRSTLILQLGRVLAPVDALATRTPPPTNAEYQVVAASIRPDMDRWMNEVSVFVSFGSARFEDEYNEISQALHGLRSILGIISRQYGNPSQSQTTLCEHLANCKQKALQGIDRVPIEWTARLHESKTPFTVCLKIRDAISTAKHRVHYFDRYVGTDFFLLYLRDLSRTLEVRVVTTKGNTNYGVANVMLLSKLAAREFSNFALIECQPTDLHDRNLRVDDTVFFLGTSIKDAGTQPTNFSPADCTPAGHSILDGIIANGVVVT